LYLDDIETIYNINDVSSNFTISANAANFTAVINGSDYNATLSTTNGSIVTPILENSTFLYNISLLADGFFDLDYSNYNVSVNPLVVVFEDGVGFHVDFSDFVEYNSSNYTRTLQLEYHFDHCPSNNTANTFIDGVLIDNFSVDCVTGSDVFVYKNYTHSVEGAFNISFNGTYLIGLDNESFSINASEFISDLFDPVVNVNNFSLSTGFSDYLVNVSYSCSDNVTPLIFYNASFNSVSLLAANRSNNTLVTNNSLVAVDGDNVLFVSCSDFFSSVNDSVSDNIFAKTLFLIDEIDNVGFDVSNISGARVYFDDNSTFFDFKSAGVNKVNFTSLDNDKLRFELSYSTGEVITRYIDISLISEDIRVCANKDGVTHFEQLVISSTALKVVLLENIFSNCYVAADYIRFAYQDAYVLKAYTISSLYGISTLDGGSEVLLASVDGSISSYINIDTLEFSQTGYNLNILGDGLSFEKSDSTTIQIYYENLNDDNEGLSLVITRLDTGDVVFSKSSFTDPNTFTLYFNYATLFNVTDDTLFSVVLSKTKADGVEEIKRYFNTGGKTGILNSAVAFTFSFLIVLFGLTFTISRVAFSWFGVLMVLTGIGTLSFAIMTWYILLLMAMEVIILVWVGLLLVYQNYPEVAG
jgi:hypothetical protein